MPAGHARSPVAAPPDSHCIYSPCCGPLYLMHVRCLSVCCARRCMRRAAAGCMAPPGTASRRSAGGWAPSASGDSVHGACLHTRKTFTLHNPFAPPRLRAGRPGPLCSGSSPGPAPRPAPAGRPARRRTRCPPAPPTEGAASGSPRALPGRRRRQRGRPCPPAAAGASLGPAVSAEPRKLWCCVAPTNCTRGRVRSAPPAASGDRAGGRQSVPKSARLPPGGSVHQAVSSKHCKGPCIRVHVE